MGERRDLTALAIERLDRHHVRDAFDCGSAVLNDWLLRYAGQNQRADNAVTRVAADPDGLVAGYHTLSTSSIARSDVSGPAGRAPEPIPAILLGRLAVDREWQGIGLGSRLVADAITRACAASELVGARLLLVDAMDERAMAFWRRLEFEASPTSPHRLMRSIRELRAHLP